MRGILMHAHWHRSPYWENTTTHVIRFIKIKWIQFVWFFILDFWKPNKFSCFDILPQILHHWPSAVILYYHGANRDKFVGAHFLPKYFLYCDVFLSSYKLNWMQYASRANYMISIQRMKRLFFYVVEMVYAKWTIKPSSYNGKRRSKVESSISPYSWQWKRPWIWWGNISTAKYLQ